MNLVELKNLASAVQSFAVALAAVVGGAWALYRYASLQEVKKATAQLHQLQRELRERGILKIEMAPLQLALTASGHPILSVDVSVENTGNRTEVIGWDRSRLQATLVQMTGAQLDFGATVSGRYVIAGSERPTSSILPGQSRTFPILLVLPQPGLYQLVFWAIVSPSELELQAAEHRGAGHDVDEIQWTAARYHAVR